LTRRRESSLLSCPDFQPDLTQDGPDVPALSAPTAPGLPACRISGAGLCRILVAGLLLLSGCQPKGPYPDRPITLICPWAAGGGTDQVSRQVAVFLEQELGVPVNVANATGGQGVTGHARGLGARPDGYTVAMLTFELNTLHWRGLTDLTYRDAALLMSLNEDPAALFVRNDSPFQSARDLETAVRDGSGRLKASGTAALGAWHLAVAGWLISRGFPGDAIDWVPSQGAKPSLQELMSGGVDLVCCSLPEASSLLLNGDVRCLGVMSRQRMTIPECAAIPTLIEQGSDWTLTGWRGLGVPRDTPPGIQARLITALERIVRGETRIGGETFPEFMDRQWFDHTARPQEEFTAFLAETDQQFGEIMQREEFQFQAGPVGPMAFPALAAGLLGLASLSSIIPALRRRRMEAIGFPSTGSEGSGTSSAAGVTAIPGAAGERWILWLGVLFCAAAFIWLSELLGFLLAAAVLLASVGILLRGRTWRIVALALLAPPVIYVLFAGLLRVPLPMGLLEW